VSDEIITSHAGVRVRIGNTDAEGRLVLADLLSHLRSDALSAPAPLLLSIATLTGHANRAVGPYCIAIDNRWARIARVGAKFMTEGDRWGDPFEVSRLRREDWDFVKPRSKADDVLSCNNAPSSATERGHQFPMAFLAIASGLAPHCHRDSEQRLAYTHLDIAGAATERGDWQHGRPSGAPVVALCAALLEG
jgi:leucyl aminopeptidase